jgi:glycosyltransferase involved in cell wall biosynthesis
VSDGAYYQAIYERDKRDFGDFPHLFFGRQLGPVNDAAVLPYLTDSALLDLYAATPVFIYPSTEPRHVHYSPLEAMVVGAPVLYRRGTLIDLLAGADLPGACADIVEMREKARRLLAGDKVLADAIRATQERVLGTFAVNLIRQQWTAVLARTAVSAESAA